MSVMLSVTLLDSIEIKVSELVQETQKVFNELLGLNEKLDLDFLNEGFQEKITLVLPEKWGEFLDKKWSHYGGAFLYSWNEYWEDFGDQETYDFLMSSIDLEASQPVTAIQIAMLIAVAKMGGVNHLMDTQSLLGAGDEFGYIAINDVLALKVEGYSDVYAASKAFYKKLDYRRFRE